MFLPLEFFQMVMLVIGLFQNDDVSQFLTSIDNHLKEFSIVS